MKIGVVSDSLAHLSREAMLDAVARLGVEGVELNAANWTSAPHLDLKESLESAEERKGLLDAFKRRGLEIIALNANGNQLHPVDGQRQSEALYDTIRLANALGVATVVCMSGLPEGAAGDLSPNWVVSSWPPETQTILKYQWEERLLPYWRKLAGFAKANGVRLAVELHGAQLVYNVATLLRLRNEIGATVGANFDPSHLMWMGAAPIAAIDALRGAIHHTHAKDTMINKPVCDVNSRLENGSLTDVSTRAWSYVTLGFGNGESFWRDFCCRLRMNGYDGWLSIEHEDVLLSREEGVRKAVALLKAVAPSEAADYKPQEL